MTIAFEIPDAALAVFGSADGARRFCMGAAMSAMAGVDVDLARQFCWQHGRHLEVMIAEAAGVPIDAARAMLARATAAQRRRT